MEFKIQEGTSLVAQWLRLHASSVGYTLVPWSGN